jgi:hypothetical protein
MDWKEFLKKYGIYIAIGLVGLYFLLRRPSSPRQPAIQAGSGRIGSGGAGGVSTTSGVVRQPATATQPVTNPPRRPGGTAPSSGAATASAYAGLIFSGINQFMNLLDRISGISTRRSRTPPTFPGGQRGSSTSRDGLIRIIDANGVETVIASGYYDIPPDFGVPSDYWATSDSGSTFYNDAFSDSSDPYSGLGSGGSIGDTGYYNGADAFANFGRTIVDTSFDPGESELPRVVYDDGSYA